MILHVKCVIMVVSKRVEEENPQLFFICGMESGIEKSHDHRSRNMNNYFGTPVCQTEKEVSLCGTDEKQKEIC